MESIFEQLAAPDDAPAIPRRRFMRQLGSAALLGAGRTPWRFKMRHSAATTVLLPASDVVPCTISVEKG